MQAYKIQIMNILVTGGAGYKGNILARSLLAKGHNVTIYDNFMYGYTSILDLVNHRNCQVIKKDVRDIEKKEVKKHDLIYHLAAISGLPACRQNPALATSINYDATRKLVNLLSKNQILVYASTTSLYGVSDQVCTEDSKVEPISLYGKTKRQSEKIVLQHANSIVLRFATLFGVSPRMRTDLLVNNFVYRAIADRSIVIFDPHNTRSFLHLNDAMDAYLLVLKNYQQMKGQIFNVGTNELSFSKLELAQRIQKYLKFQIFESNIADIDKRSFMISYDKISLLGFKARTSIEFGIKELMKLYSFYDPQNEKYV